MSPASDVEALVLNALTLRLRVIVLTLGGGLPHMLECAYFRTFKLDQVCFPPPLQTTPPLTTLCLGPIQANNARLVYSTPLPEHPENSPMRAGLCVEELKDERGIP